MDGLFVPEQPVLMETFATKLRKRAEELGISNAEAGRRVGLSERRYGHYISGAREPDLATLVRIAEVLETTPNNLLGVGTEPRQTKRSTLKDRLNAAASVMEERELHLMVIQAEAVAASRSK
jgi:transcriptional regulator with XRE-family HTH domain